MRAIILGNFDGVHLGHQALLKAAGIAVHSAQDRVGDALSVHVWTFNPPPRSVLSPDFKVERLQRVEDRVRQLHLMGATGVEVIRPTVELLGRSAADFITQLHGDRGFDFIVEGPDFRFGKGREGSMDLLRTLGGKLGFEVIEVPAVSVQLSNGTTVQARSGAIRQLLHQGNVGDAGRILGRPFSMRAQVVRGEQRGRTIGWPTANLDAEDFAQHQLLIPADGVYAGFGRLSQAIGEVEAASAVIAAISVGTKPTFGGTETTVEATLLAPDGRPLEIELDTYGWSLELEFREWIRPQVRFPSLEALLAQMELDRARIVELATHFIEVNPTAMSAE